MPLNNSTNNTVIVTLLVAHPTLPKVLVTTNSLKVSLPKLELDVFPLPEIQVLNNAAKSLIGVEVHVLKWLEFQQKSETSHAARTYYLTYKDIDWNPQFPFEWICSSSFADLDVPKNTLECLNEIKNKEVSLKRSSWSTPGWLQELENWLTNVKVVNNFQIIDSIKQLKVWQLSCLWQIPSSIGNLYFKSSADFFASETKLTVWLSNNYQKYTPQILSFDLQKNWLLMREFQGIALADVGDIEIWKSALAQFAQMQIDISTSKDELLELGIPDRSLCKLKDQYDQLFKTVINDPEHAANFAIDEVVTQKLIRQDPHIRKSIEMLLHSHIPLTLDHGDLHPGNIIISQNEPLFFDWSDCSITHPFFALAPFLNILKFTNLKDATTAETRNSLIESYLEPWSLHYGSTRELRAEFDRALEIANVHLACGYYYYIIPNLEQPSEWSRSVGSWLKK